MVMPAELEDLGFLEGCRNINKGNLDAKGKPILVVTCFDGSGRGTPTIDRPDSGGRPLDRCPGTATARIEGKKIRLRYSRSVCAHNPANFPATLWCERLSDGRSGCTWKSDNFTKINKATLCYHEKG
jgi:hypothetical protein